MELTAGLSKLGTACNTLLTRAGDVHSDPQDSMAHKELIDASKKMTLCLAHMLSTLNDDSVFRKSFFSLVQTINDLVDELSSKISLATDKLLGSVEKQDISVSCGQSSACAQKVISGARALLNSSEDNFDARVFHEMVSNLMDFVEQAIETAMSLGKERNFEQWQFLGEAKAALLSLEHAAICLCNSNEVGYWHAFFRLSIFCLNGCMYVCM